MESSNKAPSFWPIVLAWVFIILFGLVALVMAGAALNALICLKLGNFLLYVFMVVFNWYIGRKFNSIKNTIAYNFALEELMYQVETGKEMSNYSKRVLVKDDEDEEKRDK